LTVVSAALYFINVFNVCLNYFSSIRRNARTVVTSLCCMYLCRCGSHDPQLCSMFVPCIYFFGHVSKENRSSTHLGSSVRLPASQSVSVRLVLLLSSSFLFCFPSGRLIRDFPAHPWTFTFLSLYTVYRYSAHTLAASWSSVP
jgi:hypothetical protein